MLVLCLERLIHHKMSAFGIYAHFESCMPLVNRCVNVCVNSTNKILQYNDVSVRKKIKWANNTHATQANKCRLTKHILANMNVRRHSYIGEVVALIQTSSTDPLCNLTVKKSWKLVQLCWSYHQNKSGVLFSSHGLKHLAQFKKVCAVVHSLRCKSVPAP